MDDLEFDILNASESENPGYHILRKLIDRYGPVIARRIWRAYKAKRTREMKNENSFDGVFNDPSILKGVSVHQVANVMKHLTHRWKLGTMGRSSRAVGRVWREFFMRKGKLHYTGQQIQYHPGTPRHFNGNPYFKVTNQAGDVFRYPASFPL